MGRPGQVAGRRAGLDARRRASAGRCVDPLHPGQVDDDGAVDHAVAGDAVAAAPDGQRQSVVAGEADGQRDVFGVRRVDDRQRTTVQRGVLDLAELVVAGIAGQ